MNTVNQILLKHIQQMRPDSRVIDLRISPIPGDPANFQVTMKLHGIVVPHPVWVTALTPYCWSHLTRDLRELAAEIASKHLPALFVREERYLVFKLSDLDWALSDANVRKIKELYAVVQFNRTQRGKEPLKSVVVEHDWPEYEPTWKAIDERVRNEQQKGRPE